MAAQVDHVKIVDEVDIVDVPPCPSRWAAST
jgi:hypothetical protein